MVSAEADNGVVVINADGSLSYTPNENYNGDDVVSYVVSDGENETTGSFDVTVAPVNDAPETTGSPLTLSTDEDVAVSGDVTSLFTDVEDGTTLTSYSVAVGTATGALVDNGNGTFTYTPATEETGQVTLVATATDSDGATVTSDVIITIGAVDGAPVLAAVGAQATDEDVDLLNVDVLTGSMDPEGGTLSVVSAEADNGVVVINADGSLSYTPNENYNGCLLYTSPSPRDATLSRMPSSA